MPDTRIVLQQEMSYELKDKTLKMMIQRGGGTSVGRLGSWPSKVPRYVKKNGQEPRSQSSHIPLPSCIYRRINKN